MISKSIFLFLMLFSILGISQVKNPSGADFMEFTADEMKYEIMILTDNLSATEKTDATIRIFYDNNVIEFHSLAEYELIDDSSYVTLTPKDQEVKVIKGEVNYNPDTFLLIIDTKGNFVKGEATDKNSTTGNKINFKKIYSLTEGMRLLKKFCNNDDPLYSKVVKILQK